MSDTIGSPGSATYNSSTLYVGDGTWDNDFLLPNLVGLNFATMQYNGMGTRFRALPEYHQLILGHGVVAAITFLLIVPSAIFIARFYFRDPRMALRLHIYLQILTVFLSTVVLILGWFAVGPERSLTNPHHGIGVAIYVLILVQFLGGSIIHRIEKGKQRWKIPIKLVLHQWMGRAIALLAIAQIPLGLTLYGSPKVLFGLYALAVFLWILLYFVLSYVYQPATYDDDSTYGSYVSGPSRRTGPTATEITEDRRSRPEGHGLRNTAIFGAGLAGLAALRRKSRNRKDGEVDRRDDYVDRRGDYAGGQGRPITPRRDRRSGSRHTSGSYVEEEKLTGRNDGGERHTWRNRLLGAGAGLAAFEGAKRLFSRRREQDEESDLRPYSAAPLGGNQSLSRTDISRVQAGHAPFSPGDRPPPRTERVQTARIDTPSRHPLRQRTSRESFDSYDSRDSLDHGEDGGPRPDGRRRIAETLAAVTGIAYLSEKRRERRERKEERRLDDMRQHDMENAERISRVNSQRNRRRFGAADDESLGTETVMTGPGQSTNIVGSNPTLSRLPPNTNAPPLPASAYALPPGSNRQSVTENTVYNTGSEGIIPNNGPSYPVGPGALDMPTGPVESDPSRIVQSDTSHHYGRDAAAVALGAGAGAALANDARRRDRSKVRFGRRNSETISEEGPGTVASPVSVKVKINSDGRHVTLRRLNEEEAAAERAARRQERRARRRRAESLSSGIEDEGTRFRRNEAVRPSASIPIANVPPPPALANRPDVMSLPPAPSGPPPVPVHMSPQGPGAGISPSQVNNSAVTSPGYDTGTGTEMSAFDDNRRRRRAERAAAKQRAAQQGVSRVNFA